MTRKTYCGNLLWQSSLTLLAPTGTHNTARKIFDIILAMGTNARNAVALSLAIAGAVASPLRSDAVSLKGSTPPPSVLYSVLRAA